MRVEGGGGERVTGADGRFSFESIPFPATLLLEAPEHVGLAVVLDGPPAGEIVIPLPPPIGLRAAVVEHRRFDPIPGAIVSIEDAERSVLRRGETDEQGKVALALDLVEVRVPRGSDPRAALERAAAVVWAEAPGHNRIALPRRLLSLRLGEEEEIELRRVVRLPGRVVDEGGVGLPGARVYWGWTATTGLLSERRCEETTCDEKGFFALRAPVNASECFVAAFDKSLAPGYAVVPRAAIVAGEEFRIVLRERCQFQGRIRGERGESIVDAVVRVIPPSGFASEQHALWFDRFSLDGIGEPTHIARSGFDGIFSLPYLARGTYEVHVEHGTFAAAPGNDRTVTMPRAGTWVARMVAGGSVSGRILDAEGNPSPVKPNMILRAADPGRGKVSPLVGYDEKDGAFFAQGLAATEYLLDIACPGHEPEKLTVRPGDENLFVVLRPLEPDDSCSVEARFTHRGRNVTIPSLDLLLYDPETGDLIARRICDVSSGRAVLESIPRRVLDLVVEPRLYRPVFVPGLRFDLPDPPPLSVALETGREVRGRLVYEGPPARRPRLIALLDAGGIRELFSTTVAEDGSFTFPNMIEGCYIPQPTGPPGTYEPAEAIEIGESDEEVTIEVRAARDQDPQES
ncbi:MAG: carboxypeptidase regulatory-like domain-containing protein [Planctomycetes bacterium]|nr:carboxypeptidase regulatory-like domain-containing protein [Planctomycetota bacterium]